MKRLPLALLLFRAALAPALPALALAFGDAARPWLAALLVAGLLSDVLDGIVARAAGVSTVALRRLDSRVDLFFWLGALAAAAVLDGPALRTIAPGVAAVLALEAACQAASFARFRRAPCTHAFLSKLWGLFLGAGFAALFATGRPGALRVALAWGVRSTCSRSSCFCRRGRATSPAPGTPSASAAASPSAATASSTAEPKCWNLLRLRFHRA